MQQKEQQRYNSEVSEMKGGLAPIFGCGDISGNRRTCSHGEPLSRQPRCRKMCLRHSHCLWGRQSTTLNPADGGKDRPWTVPRPQWTRLPPQASLKRPRPRPLRTRAVPKLQLPTLSRPAWTRLSRQRPSRTSLSRREPTQTNLSRRRPARTKLSMSWLVHTYPYLWKEK